MDTLNAFGKRLRDEIATVEKEIEAYNQRLEALNQRLEGLKRAAELFESDEAAISELLRAGTADGGVISRVLPTLPVAKVQTAPASSKSTNAQQRRMPNGRGRSKTPARPVGRTSSQNGGLTRLEMIAAVLKRHPSRTVRELIALLDKEYRWKTNESAVTGLLYTRRNMFVHTPPDRATNRPVTWSSK
jgi:hypothetical protein